MLTLRRLLTISCCLAALVVPAGASAATASAKPAAKAAGNTTVDGATNQSVTQGYAADASVQKGMIVMLDPKNTSKVDPLTADTIYDMLGVVVAANDATVALSNQGNSGQVFVASFGRYDVLVSNQNGPIKAGDYVTISSLSGVGMKVDTTQSIVLGRATANFTGTGGITSSVKLKTSTGGSVTVAIGRIPVDISISHNPLQPAVDRGVPGFLRQAGEQIAGKQVGTSRIYISLVILLASCVLAGNALYSGIRGGLIAIGRNPLARRSIVAGILRVVLVGILVFAVGLLGVYIILKL